MPAELRHPTLRRRRIAHTYFVGRRESGTPELYAVSAGDVERLHSTRADAGESLDWRGGERVTFELGQLLLERVVEPPLPPELTTRFAHSLLSKLPKRGFVLDADAVWRWILLANRPVQPGPSGSAPRGPWFARLGRGRKGGSHA